MLLASPSANAATVFFDPDEYYAPEPYDVAARDLDDDGETDMIAVGGGAVTVRLGVGDGTFGDATETDLEGEANAELAVGDVDGDGDLDVAVADRFANGVFLLLGDGEGGLSEPERLATVNAIGDVAIGDFGGDDQTDLAVTGRSAEEVVPILQQADGTYVAGTGLAVPGDDPRTLATADLNGDGRRDLVTANIVSDDVSVFLQEASGFAAPATYDVGERPIDLTIADVDAVPGLDLVTADYDDSTVSILSGSPSGALSPRTVHATYSGPTAVAADDVNADGDSDLIVPAWDSGVVGLLLGDTGETFQSVLATSVGAFDSDWGLATAQLDGDGELDLLIPETGAGAVAVLLGDVLQLESTWLDFGLERAGTTIGDQLTVRNTGSGPIAPGSITIEEGGAWFSTGPNGCADITLQPRESCSAIVFFSAPMWTTGSFEGLLTVAGDDLSGERYALLTGSSILHGRLATSPKQLDLGHVPEGRRSAPKSVMVSNSGDTEITVGSVAMSDLATPDRFAVASDACTGQVLSPDESCAVTVRVEASTSLSKRVSASLRVKSADPGSSAITTLSAMIDRAIAPRQPGDSPTKVSNALHGVVNGPLGPVRALLGGARRLPGFRPPVGGRYAVRIVRGKTVLAKGAADVAASRGHRLRLRPTSHGRRALRRSRRLRVRLVASFTSQTTGRTYTRARVIVLRPKPR